MSGAMATLAPRDLTELLDLETGAGVHLVKVWAETLRGRAALPPGDGTSSGRARTPWPWAPSRRTYEPERARRRLLLNCRASSTALRLGTLERV